VLVAGGLGRLTGTVLDPTSGDVLWAKDPSRPQVPGSTIKLLTTAAALFQLDPTSRLTTRVVAGPGTDSVVLVGGGDPTLSVLPAGKESVYSGAPKIDDLAAAVRAAHPAPIHQVIVDTGRYRGGGLAEGWLPADVPGGFVAPITPLMVDGGRTDPTARDVARVADPAGVAGAALAQRLGAGVAVTEGTAAPGAAVLGEVASVPIAQLVEQALRNSDNVLAETLAREVALARGAEPSFPGAARAVLDALAAAGLDVGGASLVDGSGLSTLDHVPAGLLAAVLSKAADPTAQHDRLRSLITGLPVAGGEGTLDDRFTEGPGRGFVRAKTGTLTDVSSLAGVAVTQDGRLVVFALLSTGTSPALARPQLDAFAATLRNCGCRAG
jgi:serine-type D-Ala-D-Ala carboxypeptidase/endopeptidase (penicillin-binding protein 4)